MYRPTIAAVPGTLPTAVPGERPTITVIAYTPELVVETVPPSIDEALGAVSPEGVTWINVDGLGDPTLLARLGQRFGLHPLALEDVMNVPQRPKVERYEKHYFVVLRTMRLDPSGDTNEEQVSLFLGQGWMITVQERSDGDCFDGVREAIRQGRGRVREAGADYLAYLIIDSVVDAYFPVIESLADRMQTLESQSLAGPPPGLLERMQRTRHDLIAMRRAVWPMREEVGALLRDDATLVTAETRVFLRDVYDHAVQALDIVESLRETSVSVMEVYLSVQNQRLNEVMKVLTVIATLFIPLTFIASIYGMNFQHMPELTWRYGYAYALGLMAITAGVMIGYFRRRGWW